MSSENKSIRKILTTVQKVQLYNFLSKLQDGGKLREMTYDEIVKDAANTLPFPIGYGHIKHMLKETGWECCKAHRMITLTKSSIAGEVKELSLRLEDLATAFALKPNEASANPELTEWMEWVQSVLKQYNNRLNELERKMNMPMRVPPASSIRIVPPQGGSGTAPAGKH